MLLVDRLARLSSRSPKSTHPASIRIAAAVALIVSSCAAGAQVAHFAGVESPVASSLSTPQQVAVDFAGNVFIADSGNNRVLEEIPTASGYQETILASTGLKNPTGIAVDKFDHVYIVDSGNARILHETPFNGSYIQTLIPITGLNNPTAIAVDSSRNLYIADYGNARVLKETIAGTTYTQSIVLQGPNPDGIAVDPSGNVYTSAPASGEVIKMTPNGASYSPSYEPGFSAPHGTAVDGLGTVYVADSGSSQIIRQIPSNGTFLQSVLLSTGAVEPQSLAVDANGNLYFNDPAGGKILKLTQTNVNLGSLPVNTDSHPVSLIFSFDSLGSIAAPAVVTQGVPGKDFTDAGTGSCTTNGITHVYQVNDSCTVDVVFAPLAPGGRYGAHSLGQLRQSRGHRLCARRWIRALIELPSSHADPRTESRAGKPL